MKFKKSQNYFLVQELFDKLTKTEDKILLHLENVSAFRQILSREQKKVHRIYSCKEAPEYGAKAFVIQLVKMRLAYDASKEAFFHEKKLEFTDKPVADARLVVKELKAGEWCLYRPTDSKAFERYLHLYGKSMQPIRKYTINYDWTDLGAMTIRRVK